MDTFLENTEIHFEMTVKEDQEWPRGREWNEKIEQTRLFSMPRGNKEALDTANAIIENFNKSLRPGEVKRILINVQRVETKVIDLIDQNS